MRIQEKPQRSTNCFIIYIIAKIEPFSPIYLLYFIGYILEKDLFHAINAKKDFITNVCFIALTIKITIKPHFPLMGLQPITNMLQKRY